MINIIQQYLWKEQVYKLYSWNEWVSDCCLMPNQQLFQQCHGDNKLYEWDDNDDCFVLDQSA